MMASCSSLKCNRVFLLHCFLLIGIESWPLCREIVNSLGTSSSSLIWLMTSSIVLWLSMNIAPNKQSSVRLLRYTRISFSGLAEVSVDETGLEALTWVAVGFGGSSFSKRFWCSMIRLIRCSAKSSGVFHDLSKSGSFKYVGTMGSAASGCADENASWGNRARISGVFAKSAAVCCLFVKSTGLAPFESSIWITGICPLWVAQCNGVLFAKPIALLARVQV